MEEEDGGISRKHITCAVCLDIYSSPYALPCLHSYCKLCLKQLLGKKRPGYISCPECRKMHEIPGNDIESLNPNFILNNLIDQYNQDKLKRVNKAAKPPKRTSPEVDEDDLPPPISLSRPQAVPCAHSAHLCATHDLPVRTYCKRCDKVLCDTCLEGCEHPAERQDARVAAEERRVRLADMLERAAQHRQTLVGGLPSKEGLEEAVAATRNSVSVHVDEAFSLVQSILDSRHQRLRQELDQRMNTQCVLLMNQAQSMHDKIAALHRHTSDISSRLEDKENDLGVLSIRGELLSKVEALLKTPPFSNTVEASLSSIKFSLRDEHMAKLKDQVECFGHLTSAVYPPHCHIQGLPVSQHLTSGENCQLQLICMNGSQQPCQEIESIRSEVSVKLVSRSSDLTVPGVIRQGSGNVFFITFVTPLPGTYEIHTTINGHHVGNSPLELLVQLPTTPPVAKMSSFVESVSAPAPEMVRKITEESGKSRFSDVAVTKSGTVVATDLANDRVCVFNSNGRLQFTFGSRGKERGKLSEPRCVAVDDNEDIYISDYNNHRVQKFSCKNQGRHILTFGNPSQSDPLKHPSGITVARDNTVFVTEHFSCRILTYNTDGRNLQCYSMPQGDGPRQMRLASYITVGPNRTLYVADKVLECVHVVSTDGGYVRRLIYEGRFTTKLRRPLGIAVHPRTESVYITEVDGHCVTTVTKNGAMQHFGQKGSSEGDFNQPQGVFYHEAQQLLYVVDQGNKRILVFKCN